jgi:hypothetical protein
MLTRPLGCAGRGKARVDAVRGRRDERIAIFLQI